MRDYEETNRDTLPFRHQIRNDGGSRTFFRE
jgi:hypothetical protein